MGSTGRRITGTGTVTATGAMGKNATATLHGIGGFSPDPSLTLVVPASATLQGSGGLSPAPTLIGVANALATLAGTSTFAGTADALGHLTATLAGLGEITDAAQHATGHMEATVLPYSDLSPQGLANAVWNALAAGSNEGGTMGEKLNAAGTAGDPWTAELPASYVDGTAGNIIAMIAALLRNKTVTDPATGVMTVYDDNGVDVLFEADIFEDAAGTAPYDGQGVNRRDRLA